MKRIKGEFGEIQIDVPRDRNGEFEPVIIPKGQSRFSSSGDKIISMYAQGMSTLGDPEPAQGNLPDRGVAL